MFRPMRPNIGSNLCTGVRASGRKIWAYASGGQAFVVVLPDRCVRRGFQDGWCNRRRKLPTEESPERGSSGKESGHRDAERGLQGLQRRRRRSLFRSHGRPDAAAAQADAARRRLREGREKPPRQDRSRRHGRRFHRSLAQISHFSTSFIRFEPMGYAGSLTRLRPSRHRPG